MTAADLLASLSANQIVLSAGILVVLGLRELVRSAFGSEAACRLWFIPILMASTQLLPTGRAAEAFMSSLVGETQSAPYAAIASAPLALTRNMAAAAIILWMFGVFVTAATLLIRQQRFRQSLGKLRPARLLAPSTVPILISSEAGFSPLLLGLLAPRIVVPADFLERFLPHEQAMVLAHEASHAERRHAQANGAACLMQIIFWFNPLVHVAAARLRVDQELVCDAAVVMRFPDSRRTYAEAMMKTRVAQDGLLLACHWSPSSARILKERIVRLKQPYPTRARRWAGTVAVCALSATLSCAAWANQPQVRNVGQQLHLTVGQGVIVRSEDGRFMCANNARCRFEPESNVLVLRAEGRAGQPLHWTGCSTASSSGACVVDLASGRASVEIR